MTLLARIIIDPVVFIIIGASLLGILYSFWKSYEIKKLKLDDQKISGLSDTIKGGVITFIKAEYKFMLLFVLSLGILAFFYGRSEENLNGLVAVSVILGAVSAAAANYVSLRLASSSTEKVTSETQKSYSEGFKTAFSASSSVGVIGISSLLLGFSILMILTPFLINKSSQAASSPNLYYFLVSGFALGASAIAIFASLGGSLFAKGADVSESEIIASEPGINEKSPYSPASVANEAGQNISNVGGIGSSLFESLTVAILVCMLLGIGLVTDGDLKTRNIVLLPLVISAIGIISSIGGSFVLRSSEVSTSRKAINIAESFAALVLTAATFFAVRYLLPAEWETTKSTDTELIITTYKGLGIFWSAVFGIAASIGIGYITKYYTSRDSQTIKNIVNKSTKGVSGNLLGGIEQGLLSTGIPVAIIISIAVASYYFAGFYGLGITAVGFMGNAGLQLAFNAFAPISENTNSVAIKADLDIESIKRTKDMKLTGIQSVAQGKIFLVVAAFLTSLAALSAVVQMTGLNSIDVAQPIVLASLFVGSLLPSLMSSNILGAVSRIGKQISNEVKRQFTEIPELDQAKDILDKYSGDLTYATAGEKEIVYSAENSADYNQCIEKATYASIWETLIPGIIAITIPVLIAYFGTTEMLAALLLGTITTGTIVAIYQANKGSALGNTKYALEEGVLQNGEILDTNSPAYQASLEGNKIGKLLKDTTSPAITVLMKVMIIVSIMLIPLLISKSKVAKALHVENKVIIEEDAGSCQKMEVDKVYLL